MSVEFTDFLIVDPTKHEGSCGIARAYMRKQYGHLREGADYTIRVSSTGGEGPRLPVIVNWYGGKKFVFNFFVVPQNTVVVP